MHHVFMLKNTLNSIACFVGCVYVLVAVFPEYIAVLPLRIVFGHRKARTQIFCIWAWILLRESAAFVLDLAPNVPEHPAVKVGDLACGICHHQRVLAAGESSGRGAALFAFASVEVRETEAVSQFMLQHVNAEAGVDDVQIGIIGQALSPVAAAAPEGGIATGKLVILPST